MRDSFEKNLESYYADLKKDLQNNNRVIQACFSLDRLQKILYYTIDAKKKGIIPKNIPIIVDSKMGAEYIPLYIREAQKQLIKAENPEQLENWKTNTKDLDKFIQYLNPQNHEYEIVDTESRDEVLASLK